MKKLIGLFFGLLIVFGIAAGASAITIDLNTGTSFQNEGTTQSVDTTAMLRDLDGSWGPGTISGIADYYASGLGGGYLDAISLNFDLSGIGYSNITDLELRFYVQKGDYVPTFAEQVWEHYQVLQGVENPTNQDFGAYYAPGNIDFYPTGDAADNQTIGWISYPIDLSWVTSDNFDVTLRLWNARIDRVELVANTAPAPDCSVPALLPDQIEVLSDHFDDNTLNPSWSQDTESVANTLDLFEEAGTDLIVTDIAPEIINAVDPRDGGTWAKAILKRSLSSAIDDFDAYFCISWASEGLETMQGLYVVLYDTDGNQIARSGYIDDVMYGHGLSFKQIGDGNETTNYAGGSTGSDLIHISRRDGEVTIDWEQNGMPITGTNANPLDHVELEFWHYGYDGSRGVSNFGTESVDLVQIVESSVPEPRAVLSITKEVFDVNDTPLLSDYDVHNNLFYLAPSGTDTLKFKLTVANSGNLEAPDVTVRDILPDSLQFLSASSPDYNAGLWTVGDLTIEDPGNSASLMINTEVGDIDEGTIISNYARILSDGPSDSVKVIVGGVNLELSVSVWDLISNYYSSNFHVFYDLEVTNHGPETSPPVTLYGLVPEIKKLDGSHYEPSKITIEPTSVNGSCQEEFDLSNFDLHDYCNFGTIDAGQTITHRLDIFFDSVSFPDLKIYYDFRLLYTDTNSIENIPIYDVSEGFIPVPIGPLNYETSVNGVTDVIGRSEEGSGGFCFIATAAYGSYWEPQVITLRQFRDMHLLTHRLGREFVEVYYRYSPPFADFIAQHDKLRVLVRIGLVPLIGFSWLAINYGMQVALAVLLSALISIIGGTYFFLSRFRKAS